MKNGLKNFVIILGIVVLAFIILIIYSKNQSDIHSQEIKISEEDQMNNLKNLIPFLNTSKEILTKYKCEVSFYYSDNLIVINTKDQEQRERIECEKELLYHVKQILDNPSIRGITWKATKKDAGLYEMIVGVKMMKSGYISAIIYGNEGYEDVAVFLGDNWYYREMQGE